MSTEPFIAIGGENLIDYVTQDGDAVAHPGGSPVNVAMALGRQGVPVHYISPISTDRWGDMLADKLVASNVILTGDRLPEPTTMARVTITKGIPSYSFERDGTAERMVTTDVLQARLTEDAVALHTGSLTLTDGADAAAWEEICARSYDSGRLVSLDPNVRLSVIADVESYRDRIWRMLQKVHLVKLSDEDLAALYPDLGQDEALAALKARSSARLIVLTKGASGCTAICGDTRLDLPAARVEKLVDTVGAGDTFTATILAGLAGQDALRPDALDRLTDDRLEALMQRASIAAALNCSRAGCNPPSRAELDLALT
ncbi:carbohydrate kinase family protein [Tropicimonas isoalkanivorans]|uniref:Fructokinase n=1 Tax=Tropicimonas isoalkanivorans TaxID=441112 RepID=A0A1I1M555_9RHOB|nr:carbohydrate kinase [Tropicimonas isoalkanivorans]SFC80355.1 fructokinase [Tropicimonas isoalkanivorans]